MDFLKSKTLTLSNQMTSIMNPKSIMIIWMTSILSRTLKQEHLEPDQPQPPEPIEPEVPDQGASTPIRRSLRTCTQPQRLIPSFTGKPYETTAGVTTHLIHPEAHIDPNYTLVAHIVMVQYSMKAGMKQFKQRGEDAVSKELSQLHF
jgi:hypothetical protein